MDDEENRILWRMKDTHTVFTYTPARFKEHAVMTQTWEVVAEGDWEFLKGVKKILAQEAAYDDER